VNDESEKEQQKQDQYLLKENTKRANNESARFPREKAEPEETKNVAYTAA
jgi:hypothetical protein